MVTETDPRTEPRTPLSKERLLRAAFTYADEHSIESLTMRKLARELGFEVMSLYNHVANKDEVLDGIVDLVASEIDPPAEDTDWKRARRESAISAHKALQRHPWATSLWMSRLPGPSRARYMESVLAGLREAGFSVEMTHHGFHALNDHILGFTLQELSFASDAEALDKLETKFFRDFPAERYPYLTEHAMAHRDQAGESDGFEFVLDLILDGLERVRDGRWPTLA